MKHRRSVNIFRRAAAIGSQNEWVANYGGGLNTIAYLIVLARLYKAGHLARKPRVIFMADPGSEKPHTLIYRDEVANPWLESIGWPIVTVSSRAFEAQFRPKAEYRETLLEECYRKRMLPSAAYGHSSCSQKYKHDVACWYMERQEWAQEVWARGERIEKVIGYDAGETRRVRDRFGPELEHKRYFPSYPLVLEDIDRDECERIVAEEGLPPVGKSSCSFCPNNQLAEWQEVHDEYPDHFAQAVELSRLAYDGIDEKERFGLMRCMPDGKKHLHLWDGATDREVAIDQMCGCIT